MAELLVGRREDVPHGVPGDVNLSGSGGDPNRSEEAQNGHPISVWMTLAGAPFGAWPPLPSSAMTRLLVVRHGQSEWNAIGRWQGRADPPLTDEGRRQAAEAAKVLGTFDAVVASPLVRAVETASVLAGHLGIGPVLIDSDLMERDAGEWQGLTRTQIESGWPDFLGSGRRPPGYETDQDMVTRVRAALDRVSDQVGDGDVLVVSHGGVVYTLEESCGEPWRRIPNLGARWFDLSDSVLTAGHRVELIADGTIPDVL